jgi:hypothetical protein
MSVGGDPGMQFRAFPSSSTPGSSVLGSLALAGVQLGAFGPTGEV